MTASRAVLDCRSKYIMLLTVCSRPWNIVGLAGIVAEMCISLSYIQRHARGAVIPYLMYGKVTDRVE